MNNHIARIVVKIGTSTLAHATGLVNLRNLENLVKALSDIKNMGYDLILVSSGAIGVGVGKLGLPERPTDVPSKQAAAAVGQSALMYLYDQHFSEYNHTVAQVLLTNDVLDDAVRAENVKNTFSKLSEMGAIAIVNENDTVATEEIVFGDNDTLSAVVSTIVEADKLIILSDIEGLYDKNPREYENATLISDVYEINDDIRAMAGEAGSRLGSGGMITKIRAASIATAAGIDTYIIYGLNPALLYEIIEGRPAGTHFHKKKED
ncbi:MAG: glutamate 5-kinase [Eubacteriaceae bacterium]|nr:glutamate 5-kinase [Eubacteriaceae bacterium]